MFMLLAMMGMGGGSTVNLSLKLTSMFDSKEADLAGHFKTQPKPTVYPNLKAADKAILYTTHHTTTKVRSVDRIVDAHPLPSM